MEHFCKLIKTNEDFISIGGVTEAEITEAENTLSLRFAEEYKKYLADFGAAAANGHEFTGIVNSARLNVVDVTKKAKERNSHASGAFYVVEECLIDSIIVWQTDTGEIFQSVGNGVLEKTYNSLGEYFMV